MITPNYIYDATVVFWVDGDTVALDVEKHFDMGFHVTLTGKYRSHFRLLGINTPEKAHPGYHEATAAANALAPVGSMVRIVTARPDKFGRYLAWIWTPTGVKVNEAILAAGNNTVPYFAGGPVLVQPEMPASLDAPTPVPVEVPSTTGEVATFEKNSISVEQV